jgi:Family of unknown function (DUF5758)
VDTTTPLMGWKKCRDGVLVQIEVPPEARRSSVGREHRAECAKVLQVVGAEFGISLFSDTVYRIGEVVRAHHWNEDQRDNRINKSGIYFYVDRLDAENH